MALDTHNALGYIIIIIIITAFPAYLQFLLGALHVSLWSLCQQNKYMKMF